MSQPGDPSRRRVLAFLRLTLAGVLFAGCLSPTLPLPPPAAPDLSPPDSAGYTTLRGRVPGETTALAKNLANGKLAGQVTDQTGLYELQLLAEPGDNIAVWYVRNHDESGSVIVVVPTEDDGIGGLPVGGSAGAGGAAGQ